jgi:hypothetical protein
MVIRVRRGGEKWHSKEKDIYPPQTILVADEIKEDQLNNVLFTDKLQQMNVKYLQLSTDTIRANISSIVNFNSIHH